MVTSLFFLITAPAKKEDDAQALFPEDPSSAGQESYKNGE